jgi:hypothetical protein
LCGRKRHLLVDTLGLVLLVVETAADVQDRDGARTVLSALSTQFRRLRVIWADGDFHRMLLSTAVSPIASEWLQYGAFRRIFDGISAAAKRTMALLFNR